VKQHTSSGATETPKVLDPAESAVGGGQLRENIRQRISCVHGTTNEDVLIYKTAITFSSITLTTLILKRKTTLTLTLIPSLTPCLVRMHWMSSTDAQDIRQYPVRAGYPATFHYLVQIPAPGSQKTDNETR